ncbi:PQQ-binding-like beta-propeller repeat protein [Kitasatospora sp. NPDC058965]|uniref:protein kinase domain-containing protein n=1 Tax=Kitasatospora sp. NPDC058965 TaxID=3346682 RepID=UPI0036CC97BB
MEPLQPGDLRRIGPYRLVGRLGAGGMGAVFLGRSAAGRTVAVKVIRPELADDPRFRARFKAEVSAARAVSGAFTAPVIDADADAELPWLATAFVSGISLHQAVVRHGPLPEPVLRALTAGMAEALVGIHDAGLTHRDLKPGNVLLALDGPHVIDFGIARDARGAGLTEPGVLLGTPAYMSPEQARAQPLTAASDVFALGATLGFAARGEAVFGTGPAIEVLIRVVEAEPDLAAVPPGLRLLIAACLAKDPADRPTPRQVVEAVERGPKPVIVGAWLPPAVLADIDEVTRLLAPQRHADPNPDPNRGRATGPNPDPNTDRATGTAATAPVNRPAPAGSHDGTFRLVPAADAFADLALPDPGRPAPDSSGAPGPGPSTPGRRRVLLAAAGTVLALGAGGTALALARGTRTAGPSLTDVTRPLATTAVATPLWTLPLTDPLVQLTGSSDTVVLASATALRAVDSAGKPRWGPVPNATFPQDTPVAVSGGAVLAAHNAAPFQAPAALRAIDLATGTVRWTSAASEGLETSVSVVGVVGSTVYLTGYETDLQPTEHPVGGARHDFVRAVDTAHGTRLWHATYPQWREAQQVRLLLPGSGPHLLRVSTNLDGTSPQLFGLDASASGRTLWQQPAPASAAARAGDDGTVFVGHRDDSRHRWAAGRFLYLARQLYAVDPATGDVSWHTRAPSAPTAVAVSEDGTVVYAAGSDFQRHIQVCALDAATGDLRWAGTLPSNAGTVSVPGAAPVPGSSNDLLALQCADGHLYLWANGRAWALNPADGTARWSYQFSGVDPTVTNSVLFWAGGGVLYGVTGSTLVAVGA